MPGGAHENMKAWEPEEDHIIMEMHAAEGPKWKSIVKKLPGRTVSSVRNRWQRIEKGRKLREEGSNLKNRCHACGEPKRGHICYAKMRGGPQVELPTPQGGLGGSSPGSGASGASGLHGSGMSSHHPGQPPLKRTRSGSKLVPDDRAGTSNATGYVSHGFSVDVDQALDHQGVAPQGVGPQGVGPAGPRPEGLQRTNTSFFRDLVSSDLFSPGSRELFQAWADSPRAPTPNGVGVSGQSIAAAVAVDAHAPASLSRVVSSDGAEPPKITRSLTSYLKEISDPSYPPAAAASSSAAPPSGLSRQPSLMGQPSLQPSLSRMQSAFIGGRNNSEVRNLLGGQSIDSFARGLVDESMELSSAPPPNALPPALQYSTSLNPDALSDDALSSSLGFAPPSLGSALGPPPSLSALGGPPPLSRRSSRGVPSPRNSPRNSPRGSPRRGF